MKNLVRVLWALYRGPSKDPRHQPACIAVHPNELPRRSRLQQRFWRLFKRPFWTLYYRSKQVPLRVFRVRREQGNASGAWIIYNDPARNLFLATSYHGNPPVGSKIRELRDVEDAWTAVRSLRNRLHRHLDFCESLSSGSVPEACDRLDAMCREIEEEEELAELTLDLTNQDVSDLQPDAIAETLGAQDASTLTTSDPFEQDYDYEGWADQRSRDTLKLARAKDVRWKPIDPTPDGRECDILVIDGREVHRLVRIPPCSASAISCDASSSSGDRS